MNLLCLILATSPNSEEKRCRVRERWREGCLSWGVIAAGGQKRVQLKIAHRRKMETEQKRRSAESWHFGWGLASSRHSAQCSACWCSELVDTDWIMSVVFLPTVGWSLGRRPSALDCGAGEERVDSRRLQVIQWLVSGSQNSADEASLAWLCVLLGPKRNYSYFFPPAISLAFCSPLFCRFFVICLFCNDSLLWLCINTVGMWKECTDLDVTFITFSHYNLGSCT